MLQVMYQAHRGGPGSRGFFFLTGITPSHPAAFPHPFFCFFLKPLHLAYRPHKNVLTSAAAANTKASSPGHFSLSQFISTTPSHPAFFFLMWYRSLVFFPTFLCYNQLRKEVFCMARFPDDIDIEIAKIWLAGQDLRSLTPEQAKEKFFEAVHKMESVNPERWD